MWLAVLDRFLPTHPDWVSTSTSTVCNLVRDGGMLCVCRDGTRLGSRVIDLLSRTYRVWLTKSMLAPLWSLTGSISTVLSVINA